MRKFELGASRYRGLRALSLSCSFGFSRFRYRSIASATLRAVTIPCALLLLVLTSCKQKPAVETSFAIPENAVPIEEQSAAQNAFSIEEQAIAQNASTSPKSSVAPDGSKIDFDLSEMNSDLVYASVFQMMIDPDTFANKVIKMRGNFVSYPSSSIAGGKTYAVIISDALACCKQGIEFHYDFGGKEPKEGDIITVTGKYTCEMLPGEIFYNYVKADSVQL